MFHLTGLDIHERENQGIVVLELHGKLHMGSGDETLSEFAESLLAQGKRQVILDLAKVSDIDGAGVKTLLILAGKYRGAGGRLGLFGLNPAHAEVYEAAANSLPTDTRDALIARLDRVRSISHKCGYGVGDDMDSMLIKYTKRKDRPSQRR